MNLLSRKDFLLCFYICCVTITGNVECIWYVMAHVQKPDLVFRRDGRVHSNWQGCQFSWLLAAVVCASAVVMLGTLSSEVVWRGLATHSIRQFPLHFPSRASPCAITFQLDCTSFGIPKWQYSSSVLADGNLWTFEAQTHITAKYELQNVGFSLCQTASRYNHLWRQLCFQQKLITSFVTFKLHHVWKY